jgi:plastocyanin
MSLKRSHWVAAALSAVCLLTLGMTDRLVAGQSAPVASAAPKPQVGGRLVMVPGEDRFRPFALVITVGQSVKFINMDTDAHTVVSNDFFVTTDNKGTNQLLPANGGTLTLTFHKPGVFPFYCRFHAMLDSNWQPTAPGPFGGIQDASGNYGTPMNGVITVLPPRPNK